MARTIRTVLASVLALAACGGGGGGGQGGFGGADAQLGIVRLLDHTPAADAVQVALDALLESYGIVPDAVVGHSIGEVAAAHRAGILSLSDAAAVICHTARLLGRVEGDGAMLLLGEDAARTGALLRAECERLGVPEGSVHGPVIAAENGARRDVQIDVVIHAGRGSD